jgi:putative intracellular protease/amidase
MRAARRVGMALLLGTVSQPVLAQASRSQPQSPSRPTSAPIVVNFDVAMRGLGFDPVTNDANRGASNAPNGIPDGDELALLAAVLASPAMDLRKSGGLHHADIRAAFEQARASATIDLKALLSTYPTAVDVTAGYMMLGRASTEAYADMVATFGAPLKSQYDLALAQGRYLAFDGDADGDGVRNVDEYRAQQSGGRNAYLRAALDPTITSSAPPVASASNQPASTAPARTTAKKTVGVVLYPGFEVLDVFGPVEMWSYVPEFRVIFVAQRAGTVRSANGVSVVADYSFESAPPLDIMMVPGGIGTRTELQNPPFVEYLRLQHARTEITSSVCTGSVLLAKAGILSGHRATSNKLYFSWAVDEDPSVDWIVKARWVEDGKLFTSSGVSAGTDMALGLVQKLYGLDRARLLARSLEYEWHEDPTVDPFALKALPTSGKRSPPR